MHDDTGGEAFDEHIRERVFFAQSFGIRKTSEVPTVLTQLGSAVNGRPNHRRIAKFYLPSVVSAAGHVQAPVWSSTDLRSGVVLLGVRGRVELAEFHR